MLTSTTSLAPLAQTSNRSAMLEMFALVSSSDLLSFAFGLPAPELIPLAA